MLGRILIGPAVVAVALGAMAGKETTPIRWSSSWKGALAEAKARNVPVLLVFGKDHWGGCEALESGTLGNKEFATFATENAVNVTGHNGRDHGTTEVVDPKTKEKSVVCKKFVTITCDDHERLSGEANSTGKFKFQYVPQSYILSPDGEILADLAGAFSKKQGIEALKEAAKKLGAGMTVSAWTKAKASIAEGDTALESGDLKKALSSFQSAGKEKGATKNLLESVQAKVAEVDAKGLEQVAAAKGNSDHEAAKKALQALARDLKGTKAGEEAAKALAGLG